eukprot:s26_g21.t1
MVAGRPWFGELFQRDRGEVALSWREYDLLRRLWFKFQKDVTEQAPSILMTVQKRPAMEEVGTARKELKGSEGQADAAAAREVEVERSLAMSGLGAAQAVHGQVPVIDLSDSRAADAMWEAAREPGFFVVTNHGISEEAIDEAFRLSRDFFNQSKENKERQSPFEKSMNAGYEFFSQVRPSTGAPDQKESLQITAREGCMDGRWPDVPNFEERLKNFMVKSHDLGCRILSILEPKACPKLAKGTLAAAHRLWVEDGQCTLRLLHYPPVHDAGKLPANYWRAGPHTDWCCATLLFQRPGNEGLECAPNPKAMKDGAPWLKVDPVPGGIAVNIGDMLGRWSDGRLLSNLHRVRMPTKEESSPPKSRYSMAFFMQADKHVRIECETCETITAGDYILGRIRSNFAK